jgi:hypothetical protein
MISKLENHEALVESAVRDLERGVERAEREWARARTSNQRLRALLSEERDAVVAWRERALREESELRGVECLGRSKRAERRALELADRLVEGESAEAERALRARVLRDKLREFREQEASLRARQARTGGDGEAPAPTPAAEIAELLARWETHLKDLERAQGAHEPSPEAFAEEPRDRAEETALLYELRELKEHQR